jgi:two-component system, NarL family, nitrate/nitrite response regulator NarL
VSNRQQELLRFFPVCPSRIGLVPTMSSVRKHTLSASLPETTYACGKAEAARHPSVRVFLLLENRLLRETLTRIFRKRDDLQVVGSESKESCTPQLIRDSQCHVIVFDFLDPEWLRLTRCAELQDRSVPQFLLIGMSGEFEQFLAAVHGGVTGYLMREASTKDVLMAVQLIARGSAICSPVLCGCLFQYVSSISKCRSVEPAVERPHLTLRQQHLITLVAKGWTNKEIAAHLNLSAFTVRNHIHRILKQVGATSRSQAVEKTLSHKASIALVAPPCEPDAHSPMTESSFDCARGSVL